MKSLLFLLLGAGLAFAQESFPGAKPGQPAAPAKPAAVITQQQLESRLAELQRGKEQAVATVNAYIGAIEQIQRLLDELKSADSPKPKPANPKPTNAP